MGVELHDGQPRQVTVDQRMHPSGTHERWENPMLATQSKWKDRPVIERLHMVDHLVQLAVKRRCRTLPNGQGFETASVGQICTERCIEQFHLAAGYHASSRTVNRTGSVRSRKLIGQRYHDDVRFAFALGQTEELALLKIR